MRKEPHRLRRLYGAAHAAEQAGDTGKAREYYAKLAALEAHADPAQNEAGTAKRFLVRRAMTRSSIARRTCCSAGA